MSRTLIALLILAVAVAGLVLTARAQGDTPAPEPAAEPAVPSPTPCPPDRILVKLKPGADPAAVIGRYGGTIIQTIPGIDVQVVTVPAGTGQQTIDALNADPEVQYAEPDGVVRITRDGSSCQGSGFEGRLPQDSGANT